MSAKKIKLEVVTLEKKLLEEEVDSVVLPTPMGETGVMADHIPLVTSLEPGELRITNGNDVSYFALSGGFAEVKPKKILVLADAAEHATEIDEERAKAARKKAEETMKKKGLPEEEFSQAAAALRRAITRLRVAEKKRRSKRVYR